jgi:hypothetical protein
MPGGRFQSDTVRVVAWLLWFARCRVWGVTNLPRRRSRKAPDGVLGVRVGAGPWPGRTTRRAPGRVHDGDERSWRANRRGCVVGAPVIVEGGGCVRVVAEGAACCYEPNGGGIETKGAPERAGDEDLRTAMDRDEDTGQRRSWGRRHRPRAEKSWPKLAGNMVDLVDEDKLEHGAR